MRTLRGPVGFLVAFLRLPIVSGGYPGVEEGGRLRD